MGVEDKVEGKKKRRGGKCSGEELEVLLGGASRPPNERRTTVRPASDLPEILCLPLNILPFLLFWVCSVLYKFV